MASRTYLSTGILLTLLIFSQVCVPVSAQDSASPYGSTSGEAAPWVKPPTSVNDDTAPPDIGGDSTSPPPPTPTHSLINTSLPVTDSGDSTSAFNGPAREETDYAPIVKKFHGFHVASTDFRCALSGIPLKGRFYRLFRNQPYSVVSYEAATYLLHKDKKENRATFWKLFDLASQGKFREFVSAGLGDIKLPVLTVQKDGSVRQEARSIASLTTRNSAGSGLFVSNMSRALVRLSAAVDSQTRLGKIIGIKRSADLEKTLKDLAPKVSLCYKLDNGKDLPVDKKNTRAFVLTRVAFQYLLDRAVHCQKFHAPPIPSQEDMLQEMGAILSDKLTLGPDSMIAPSLLIRPSLPNSLKILLGLLLAVGCLAGAFFMVTSEKGSKKEDEKQSADKDADKGDDKGGDKDGDKDADKGDDKDADKDGDKDDDKDDDKGGDKDGDKDADKDGDKGDDKDGDKDGDKDADKDGDKGDDKDADKDADKGDDKDDDKDGDKDGDKDDDKDGDKGGDKDADKGGDKDDDKGGDKGGDKDDDKGGDKGGDKDADKDGDKDGDKGGDK